MGLNEGMRWKVKTTVVNCMDAVPTLRPAITKVMSPLYPLSNYDELLDKVLDNFQSKSGGYSKAN